MDENLTESTTAATASTTTRRTTRLVALLFANLGFRWLREESLQRKQLRWINEKFLFRHEARRVHVVAQFHRHRIVSQRSEYLVDLADL